MREITSNFSLKKFTDHNQFLKKCVYASRVNTVKIFPNAQKWTRMNAQIDKRTYYGNTWLTKIEKMNPEP